MTRSVTACVLALALASSSAGGEPGPDPGFDPVGVARTFSFDVEDGHYLTQAFRVSCPANAIRGMVRFSRYGRPTTEFTPGITIYLFAPAGGKFVRLGFHADNFRPPFAPSLNAGPGPLNGFSKRQFYAGRVGAGGTFSFLVTWSGRGTVSAIAGGERHDDELGARPERIEINGFSGAGVVYSQTGHMHLDKDESCTPIA